MAVTVVVAVNQSEVMAGQAVTVTGTFVNGSMAVAIAAVDRLGPDASKGVSDGASADCANVTIAASSTTVVQWKWFAPWTNSLAIYTLQYAFRMDDGTVVTPDSNPQIAVQNRFDFTQRELAGFPITGSLNLLSNTQSGLLAAI